MSQDSIFQIGTVILMLLIFSIAYYFIRGKLIYASASFLIGLTTYFLILVLSKNEFGLAAGLGLFAIFGIIRYRTEQVPILEMTYIFLCITIAVISALADGIVNTFSSIILINSCLIVISVLLFTVVNKQEESKIEILVDTIDWLGDSKEIQMEFLSQRSFQKVIGFEVISIDWLKETALVTISFRKR